MIAMFTGSVFAENKAQTEDPLIVDVTPPNSELPRDVTDPLRFKLEFKKSADTTVTSVRIRRYYLTVDDASLLGTRPQSYYKDWHGEPSDVAGAGAMRKQQGKEFDVDESSTFREVEIPPVVFYDALFTRKVLLFTPGQYDITIHVDYYTEGDSDHITPVQKTYHISLRPPFLALVIGGVFGCFLLCVFLGAYNIYRPPQQQARSLALLAKTFIESCLLFVVGSIATFILLLCILRPEYGVASTKITVHDFIGALLVGLTINLYLDLLADRLKGGQKTVAVGSGTGS